MASVNVPEFSPEPLQWEPRERAFICTKTRRRFYLVPEEELSNTGTDQKMDSIEEAEMLRQMDKFSPPGE